MYVKNNKVQDINFLASARYQNFTYQADDTGVEANANGRKIIPAGTVYKKDGKAIGLTFHDVDVTEGPQPVAVMVEGWVVEDRLPVAISEEDKASMPNIKYKEV